VDFKTKKMFKRINHLTEKYKKLLSLVLAIANALMSLSYSIIGVFLALFPDSYIAQRFLPSNKNYVYGLALLLIVYGLFRAWRVFKKFKDDDDDEDYEYYDGRKG
jgi:amino acid permease